MPTWTRNIPFESRSQQEETWVYRNGNVIKEYPVHVTLGKPVDILSLKLNMIEDFQLSVSKIRDVRISFFSKDNLEQVNFCPICNGETKNVPVVLSIYGAQYVQCPHCSHYFIKNRPSQSELESFYEKDDSYQSTYADKRTTETRVKQVAMPKAKWAIECFERIYGRKPRAILDVGAGSGHFVYACKQLGIKAAGMELSKPGREFCKKNFGFELIHEDFVKEWKQFKDYEMITFWGVVEHTSRPTEMLNAAFNILSKQDGLVVAEVPRWNCFGTSVQSIFSDSIVRHFDVLGHINCFTDSSFATAFKQCHFDVVAAWYFGMDAYELVTQISYLLKNNDLIQQLGKTIPTFQERLDLAKLSDEMVFVGKPA